MTLTRDKGTFSRALWLLVRLPLPSKIVSRNHGFLIPRLWFCQAKRNVGQFKVATVGWQPVLLLCTLGRYPKFAFVGCAALLLFLPHGGPSEVLARIEGKQSSGIRQHPPNPKELPRHRAVGIGMP